MKALHSRGLLGLIIGMAFSSTVLLAEVTYEVHRGNIDERTLQQLPTLAQVYFEFPYLCAFTPEQWAHWAAGLSRPDTIWSVAYDGSQLAGAVIAFPVRGAVDPALLNHPNFVADKALMLEEAMVALPYQKQGVGRELVRLLMHEACLIGYMDIYGLTVVRSSNHPLKPENFIDLEAVWTRLGGSRTHLTGIRMWYTRCGVPGNECAALIDNMVEYWHKALAQ